MSHFAHLPLSFLTAQLPENPEERRRAIDDGLITHAWVPDNTAAVPTTSTAEGGGSSDTSTDSSCPICNEVFVEGAMVCSSSNEKCGHVFHKTCMANWLEFQNRCAVCNEAYLSEQA